MGKRQEKGRVEKISGKKTVKVTLENKKKDRRYKKVIKVHKSVLVHDEKESSKVGDYITIELTRPLSKNKNWRVV